MYTHLDVTHFIVSHFIFVWLSYRTGAWKVCGDHPKDMRRLIKQDAFANFYPSDAWSTIPGQAFSESGYRMISADHLRILLIGSFLYSIFFRVVSEVSPKGALRKRLGVLLGQWGCLLPNPATTIPLIMLQVYTYVYIIYIILFIIMLTHLHVVM